MTARLSLQPYRDDVRREMAARAHGDIDGNAKKVAARNHVTPRTGRRWRTPDDAKGSPAYRLMLYAETAPNPHRLLATIGAVADERVRSMSDDELIERIRDALIENVHQEAADHAQRACACHSMIDRALASERDAAGDLELARLYRECAVRRITWDRIVHG